MLDRVEDLAERADQVGPGDCRPFALLLDVHEDRNGEEGEHHRRQPEAVFDRHVEQEDRQPHHDRPEIADGHPDARQPAPALRPADRLERRVVIDERGLVGEVGDDEEDEPARRADIGDEGRRPDAEHRERKQEGKSLPAAIGQGAEDWRDQGVDADADHDPQAEEEVAVPLAELAGFGQPQPDCPGDHGEAEDRVREVVQRPGRRDTGPTGGRERGETLDHEAVSLDRWADRDAEGWADAGSRGSPGRIIVAVQGAGTTVSRAPAFALR